MRARSLGVAVALSALFVAGSAAQEHPNIAKGIGDFATAGIDTVNPFNGNLVIRLPIGQSYPVNAGLSYQLALTYNSQVWEHQTSDADTRAIPARGANAGLGWSLHLGRLNPPQLDLSSDPSPDSSRNTYLAPDGSAHTFYPTLHQGESVNSGIEYTRDGSYLRLNTASRRIEFPDGSVHTFNSLTNGYLTRIEDRFGNFVSVEYLDCAPACVAVAPSSAHSWRITDLQGRTHWVHLRDTGQPDQPRVITRVDLQAFGGSRAIYKFLYNDSTDDQSTIGTPVELAGCGGFNDNHMIWFLTRLVLPDGSVYDMPKAGYFSSNIPGDLNNPCKTGLINRLQLPTLGWIEWDYILYKFPTTSARWSIWQKSTGVGVRRLVDAASSSIGQWTYSTTLSGGTTAHETLLTNQVTDPLGSQVRRYFSVCVNNCTHPEGSYEYGLPMARDSGGDGTGRFLSTQVLNASGTPLRTTYIRFEHDTPGASSSLQERGRLNQRLVSQRTVFNDDPAGTYADETFSDFDGLGHYRRQTADGNFPGSNARSSHVQYNPSTGTYGQAGYAPWPAGSPWVLTTYSFSWDQENGKTQYRIPCFETGTGFLLRHRILKDSGAAESPNDLLQVFQRDAAGNVTSESHYGGDTQALPFNACGLIPPASPSYQYTHLYTGGVRSQTSVTVGTILRTLDLTIDSSTGLVNASRDPAGKQTTFSYDALGRLTTIDPADDLLTTYNYCSATSAPACPGGVRAQVIAARKATITGPEVTATRSRFDDWGRVISEEERMPPSGSYSGRTILYNALGWKTYVSEQGTAAFGTGFRDYDAFGRPLTIRPPDGAAHDIYLSYQGVRRVTQTAKVATSTASESNAVTTEIYDRYGRLYEVTEPNGTRTRYEYDVGNRLSKVCQAATGTGTTSCGQQRLFTYDHRGFLLSERHPEKGASGNGAVSYFNYDTRGLAGRKVDGSNDLTFTYDKAERLTQIRETGGAQRVLKTFTYATQNDASGNDWRKGKIVSASRFNYVGPPFNATAEVRDTFAYRGQEGRPSEHSRQLVFNGVDEEKFTTTYAYDGLGLVTTIGYPDCVFGDCPTSDTPRTVNFGYSYGRLTSVPGFTGTAGGVSQITYHPNGLVNQVPHANGVLFTQQNDPNGIPRPGGMTAAQGGTPLWTAGTYAFDGAGNVKAIGTQAFVYDSLSRVVQGNLSGNTQSYSYDSFGNIQNITTGGALLNTPTSTATNRLTAGSYDATGNLTSWIGNTYEYDAFDQLLRYRSGAEDWVYLYGPDDERFWSYRVSGNGSLWALRDLSGKVLREYEAHKSWGTFRDYIYRSTQLLASEGTARSFTDVPPNHPYAAEIEAMKASGVTAGCGGGQYCPDSYVTRAQMAIFLLAAKGISPPACTTQIFNDVPCSYWAAPWINELYRHGITAGCGGGNYCPENTVIPVEMAVFLIRTQSPGYTPPSCITGQEAFPVDVPASHWGCPFIEEVSRRGIDTGCGPGSFCPNALLTRAKVAPLLVRAFSLPYPDMGYARHYHLDHLGTPRLITSNAASKLAYHAYYPFGAEATAFNQDTEQMKFTGHERDLANLAGSGDDLDYMHARYYSPLTGRFLSTDPIGGRLGTPQSWNLYSYVLGRPTVLSDPLGLDPQGTTVFCGYDYCDSIDVITSPWGEGVTGIGGSVADDPLRGLLHREFVIPRKTQEAIDIPNAEDKGCSVFDSFGTCLAKCASDQLGVRTMIGAGGVVAGQPLVSKPFVTPGSSSGTSIASVSLSRAFPQRLPFRVWAPTTVKPFATSKVIGRIAGRWVPWAGWALLANDLVEVAECVTE